jgi:hypothetical protein
MFFVKIIIVLYFLFDFNYLINLDLTNNTLLMGAGLITTSASNNTNGLHLLNVNFDKSLLYED